MEPRLKWNNIILAALSLVTMLKR